MKRFLVPITLALSLAVTGSGCPVAGGIVGGATAPRHAHDVEDTGESHRVLTGAAIGLVLDVIAVSAVVMANNYRDDARCTFGCAGN